MNVCMDCGIVRPAAVRQCGNVRQYERQCAAVRTAAVYGSALGSVWQYTRGSVRLSGSRTVRGCVRQCTRQCAAVRAVVCGSVWLCVAVRPVVCGNARGSVRAVRLVVCELCDNLLAVCSSAAVCGSALAAVCGSARNSVRQCVAVCLQQYMVVRKAVYAQCASPLIIL
jgi:hypothetical protein